MDESHSGDQGQGTEMFPGQHPQKSGQQISIQATFWETLVTWEWKRIKMVPVSGEYCSRYMDVLH